VLGGLAVTIIKPYLVNAIGIDDNEIVACRDLWIGALFTDPMT
jgi:hypothetical protein